jgi:hypothetical protein
LAELLTERTSPELSYLEAKWSSLLSFGVSYNLLGAVLPIGDELNTTTLRNTLHDVAERLEQELREERESFLAETLPIRPEEQPIPRGRPAFTLGLDGAYVHGVGMPVGSKPSSASVCQQQALAKTSGSCTPSIIGALARLVSHHEATDGHGVDPKGIEQRGVRGSGGGGRTGSAEPEMAPVERKC